MNLGNLESLGFPPTVLEFLLKLATDAYDQGGRDMLESLYEAGLVTDAVYGAVLTSLDTLGMQGFTNAD